MRKSIKKIIQLLSVSLTTLLLTSCSGAGVNNVLSSFQTTVSKRVNWNIEQLNRLRSVGLVTDITYEGIVKNIESRTQSLTNTDETNIENTVKNMIKPSLSYVISTTGDPFDGITGGDLEEYTTFKNYVENIGAIKSLLGDNKGNPSDGIKPLEIFATKDATTSSSGQSLNEILQSKIYVLNADIVGNDLSDIAIAMNTIKELKDKPNLNEEEVNRLAKARNWLAYFKETDMSLLDGSTSLTRVTAPNEQAYRIAKKDEVPDSVNEELNNPEGGKDLVIFSDTVPVMGIRLQELDNKVVDSILEQVNGAGDSYLIDYVNGDKRQGARVYKMYYPVSYVDSVSWDSTSNKASFETKESDLINVNIMTGKVNLINDNSYYKPEELKDIEPLYNVLGNSDNESSFTIWKKAKFKEEHNGVETEFDSNSILLKDYLEYTYMPGFMPGETYTALGRKVRLYGIQPDGSFKDVASIGKFIDKLGAPVSGAEPIQLGDLIDIKSGNKDNEKQAIKLSSSSGTGSSTLRASDGTPVYSGGTWKKEVLGGTETGKWIYIRSDSTKVSNGWAYIDGDNDGTAECYYFDNGKMAASKTVDGCELNDNGQWVVGGEVKTYSVSGRTSNNNSSTGLASDMNKAKFDTFTYTDKINPTSVFPVRTNEVVIGGSDGKENGTNNSRLIHYGLFVNTNLYKSQLYSGWLNTQGEGSGGSLNWWNEWLRKAKFTYSIDKNKLAEYLNINFTADTTDGDKDVVILDKDTLIDIQDKLHHDNRVDFINKIRTMFVALGFFCFVYGIILIGAWAIDVNFMIDTKLLGILTLGKCVAITDSIDKPPVDNGKVYMTFGTLMARLLALFGLGIVLINVDFLVVVGNIYNAIKGLADFISQGFFGK